jgi:hypothetical protein
MLTPLPQVLSRAQ